MGEKNALYVTADHDHFLHLEQNYPEVLANMVIDGNSHHMTPDWHVGPSGGLHGDVDARSRSSVRRFRARQASSTRCTCTSACASSSSATDKAKGFPRVCDDAHGEPGLPERASFFCP